MVAREGHKAASLDLTTEILRARWLIAEYGTAVHMRIKTEANGPDAIPSSQPRDPNFQGGVFAS